jgi:hypothetical protein
MRHARFLRISTVQKVGAFTSLERDGRIMRRRKRKEPPLQIADDASMLKYLAAKVRLYDKTTFRESRDAATYRREPATEIRRTAKAA